MSGKTENSVEQVLEQIRTDPQLSYFSIINDWVANQKLDKITELAQRIVESENTDSSNNRPHPEGFNCILDHLALNAGQPFIETLMKVLTIAISQSAS